MLLEVDFIHNESSDKLINDAKKTLPLEQASDREKTIMKKSNSLHSRPIATP